MLFANITIAVMSKSMEMLFTLITVPIAPIAVLGFPIAIYMPTIILLYFLFRKIKEKELRMFLIVLLIPLTNFIYYVFEHFISSGQEVLSIVLAAFLLFFELPTLFLASCILPKKILPFKKEIIVTTLFMFLFSVALTFSTVMAVKYTDGKIDFNNLEKYDSIIQEIEDYKMKNGVYPEHVIDSVKKYKKFKYTIENDGNDYVLILSNDYKKRFYHCSKNEDKICYPKNKDVFRYKQIGKWKRAIF